jgi:hypothetical protein
MHELGILDAFLQRPHNEARHLDAQIGDARLTIADFSICRRGASSSHSFHLKMQAEVTELIQDGEEAPRQS